MNRGEKPHIKELISVNVLVEVIRKINVNISRYLIVNSTFATNKITPSP